MGKIMRIRREAIKDQVDNLETFATSPKGVFETVDDSVRTFRRANRKTLREFGLLR